MEKQRLRVTIAGKNYTLATDESAEVVLEAAELVDSLLSDIGSASVTTDIAVLVSLQLAADVTKVRKLLDAVEKKTTGLSAQLDDALTRV